MDWRIKTLMTAIFLLAAFAVLSSRSSVVLPFYQDIDDKNKYLSHQLNTEAAKNIEHKGFFARTIDDPVAFFTAALAVLTGLLFIATFGLWSVAIRQSSDTKEAISVARNSDDTAKRSLRLTEKSLEIAQQSAAAADRAWLSVDAEIVGPLIFKDRKIEIEIRLEIKNLGKSPATAVYIHCELCHDRAQAAFQADDYVREERNLRFIGILNYGSVLFPGSSIAIRRKYSTDIEGFKKRISEINAPNDEVELQREYKYAYPAICISCRYGLPAEGVRARFRHTTATHEIVHRDQEHIGFDGNEIGEFSIDDVELIGAEMGFKAT